MTSSVIHPLVACATAVEGALAEVLDVDPMYMSTADKSVALLRLHRVASRLDGLRVRLIAAADDVAEADAVRDVATWLAQETRDDRGAMAAEQALGQAVSRRWMQLGAALSAGAVNLAQAHVIAHALDDLPAGEVGSEVLAQAEAQLIADAQHHGPRQLRILGRRILEVTAPDECDAAEAKAVEREERRAIAASYLSLRQLGDGTTRVCGRIPDATATRLRTYLDAYTSPRQGAGQAAATDDVRSPRRRLVEAFEAFLESADPARMPLHGGDATTLMVTIDLDKLGERLAGLGLAADQPISAGHARRLACTARIIPVVLGGKSEPLDLGRGRRLFSPAQRKAMAVRDRRCRAEGCTIPAAWCEAHHGADPWATNGRTDLADGVLLCSFHHHRVHDRRYTAETRPAGDPRFHRRT